MHHAGVAIAKSHRWPGAHSAVAKGYTVNTKNAEGETAPKTFDKAANLYIGYGYENAGQVCVCRIPFPFPFPFLRRGVASVTA